MRVRATLGVLTTAACQLPYCSVGGGCSIEAGLRDEDSINRRFESPQGDQSCAEDAPCGASKSPRKGTGDVGSLLAS